MPMKTLKLSGMAVPFVVLAAVVIWQQVQAKRLRTEVASLREQVNETVLLREENQYLAERVRGAAQRSQADLSESIRLHAQAGTNRESAQESQKWPTSSRVAVASYANPIMSEKGKRAHEILFRVLKENDIDCVSASSGGGGGILSVEAADLERSRKIIADAITKWDLQAEVSDSPGFRLGPVTALEPSGTDPSIRPLTVVNRDPNLIAHIIHDGLHFAAALENRRDGTFLTVIIPKKYQSGLPLPPSPSVRAQVRMTDDSVTEGILQEDLAQAGNAGSVDVRYRLPLKTDTLIDQIHSVTLWIGEQIYELCTF